MKLLHNSLFWVILSLYLVNRYLLTVLGLAQYKIPYLNDVLCLPVVLTLALWLHQKLFPQNCRHRLNAAQVIFVVLYFAIFFEGILPIISARYTRDYLDILAYALGGLAYYFLFNPKTQLKPE